MNELLNATTWIELTASIGIAAAILAIFVYLLGQLNVRTQSLNLEKANHTETENERRKCDERYSNLANDLSALVCTFLPDSTLTYVNQAYCDYFGSRPNELIGKQFLDFLPDVDAILVKNGYMSLSFARPSATFVHQVLRNGETVWQEWTNRAFFDDSGVITHFQAVGFDITERKQAEEALIKSESQYYNLANDLPAMICTHLPDSTLTFTNQLFCKLFNRSRDELIGNKFLSFLDEMGVTGVEDFYTSLTPDQPCATRVFQVPLNGGSRWQEWTCRAFFDENEVATNYQAMGFDITDRKRLHDDLKESNLRLTQLTDNIEDVFWLICIDKQGSYKVLYASPAFESLWQRGVDEMYEDATLWFSCIHPDDQERVGIAFDEFLLGKETFDEEYRIVRPDNSVLTIEDKGFHVFEMNGQHRVAGIARDITKKKILEKKVLQKSKMEYVGNLAGGIAHEINTPAQYIQNNMIFIKKTFEALQLLLDDYERLRAATESTPDLVGIHAALNEIYEENKLDFLLSETPDAIEQSLGGLKRITDIVQAVMAFAQPSRMEKRNTNINNLIETVVTISTSEWKTHSDIRMDLAEDMPLINCIPDLVNQAILNLLINAAQTNADKVETGATEKALIQIATRVKDDHIVMTVTDEGTGIPEHAQDKVFDLFYTTKDVGKGIGQGLAVAYRFVVEEHGGSIDFETEQGMGTTFTIRLPR